MQIKRHKAKSPSWTWAIPCVDTLNLSNRYIPIDSQQQRQNFTQGGEGGIRTRGGGFSPRTHLAGEPNRPLWHLPRFT
jgi:hypothetical protein